MSLPICDQYFQLDEHPINQIQILVFQRGAHAHLVSEEYGGFEFGMMGMGGILEETGKTLTPSPLFSTAVLGASLLEIAGSDSQKSNYLPKLVSGELTTAFALEEGSHHNPTNISTSCLLYTSPSPRD